MTNEKKAVCQGGLSNKSHLYPTSAALQRKGAPVDAIGEFIQGQEEGNLFIRGLVADCAHPDALFVRLQKLGSSPARLRAKQSDSRAKAFGDRPKVELDAIHSEQLRSLVEGAILRHMPSGRFAALMEAETSERYVMRDWAERMGNGSAA
jgi:hypothetical protein